MEKFNAARAHAGLLENLAPWNRLVVPLALREKRLLNVLKIQEWIT
jgi:hypothetical protein